MDAVGNVDVFVAASRLHSVSAHSYNVNVSPAAFAVDSRQDIDDVRTTTAVVGCIAVVIAFDYVFSPNKGH